MASGGRNLYDHVVDKMKRMGEFGNEEDCRNGLEFFMESNIKAGQFNSREEVLASMPKWLDYMTTFETKMKEAGGCTKKCPGCGGQGIKK